jgi:hypothetical protein
VAPLSGSLIGLLVAATSGIFLVVEVVLIVERQWGCLQLATVPDAEIRRPLTCG